IGIDTITAVEGDQLIVGDNGSVFYSLPGLLNQVFMNDAANGAGDIISLGAGNNMVIGGVGADKITAGNGNNVIIGDLGILSFPNGLLSAGQSFTPSSGADDSITVGDGANLLIGGFGNDTIAAGNGNNAILGDNGYGVFLTPGTIGTYKQVQATDP